METLRVRAGMAWVLSAVLLTGCATAHVFTVPPAAPDAPCLVATPEPDVLVGVALSGGGSRAALFGAAGLEAVSGLRTAAGTSVLEQVTHLSSVSGGSLAASYYALNKPARDVQVLTPEGAMSSAYRAFFDQYRSKLSQDFQTSLLWRQLVSFRWVNPALAAMTLSEVLRHNLLGEATMTDLSRRQVKGDAPRLIINTTLYNNGRRLVGTNLPSEAFRYDFFRDLERSLEGRGRPAQISPFLLKRYESLIPMTPVEMGMDACPARLAGFVTASASFPPLVGPITLKVAGSDTYWHVGDGGLYENQGAESLLFLILKQLQEKKARRALLLAFDSSFPFSVGDRRLSARAQPFSLLTFDFSRIPSIMEERATTYQALFFRSLQIEGVFPDESTLMVIPFRHIEAEWRADLSDLPPACRAETSSLKTPAAVVERIAEIPTLLRVVSECDRQLLATAATKLVEKHRTRILDFLEGRPPSTPAPAR